MLVKDDVGKARKLVPTSRTNQRTLPWLTFVVGILFAQGASGDLRVKARVPTHAARGDAAKLHCNYETSGSDGRIYSVKWYKNENEFFRYQPWSNPPAQIFAQAGVTVDLTSSNDKMVVLRSVNLTTSGRYKCEVSTEGQFITESDSGALLVVVVPEQEPKIEGGRTHYRPGERIKVNCTSGPSKPAASLAWYVNGQKAELSQLIEYRPFETRNGLEFSILGLDFEVRPEHFSSPGSVDSDGSKDGVLRLKCTASVATLYWQQSRIRTANPARSDQITVLSSVGENAGCPRLSTPGWLTILLLLVVVQM